jgi:hypothetical protein
MHDRQHKQRRRLGSVANLARSRYEEEKTAPQMDSAAAFWAGVVELCENNLRALPLRGSIVGRQRNHYARKKGCARAVSRRLRPWTSPAQHPKTVHMPRSQAVAWQTPLLGRRRRHRPPRLSPDAVLRPL